MDSDEDKRVLSYEEAKSDDDAFHDQMIDDEKKESQGFDRQSSGDDIEKMMGEKASSSVKLREGKSKSKAMEASGGNSSVRVCDFCGREFSSGKALGGHRRFHLQLQRKMEAQAQEKVNHHHTLKTNPNLSEEFADDIIKSNGNLSSRSFRCCVCQKDFPSKKSLFGHMRSHPEREWRGINPPFNDNVLASSSAVERKAEEDHGSSSSAFEEVVVDLSMSCSGSWLKKDKRGRRSIGAAEAAQNLVFLSCCGNNLRLRLPLPLPLREPPATVIPVKKRKKDMNVNDVDSSSGKHSSKKEEAVQVKAENGTDNDDDEIWKMKVMSLKKEEKKKKKMKMMMKKMKSSEQELDEKEDVLIRTLKEGAKSSRSYICSICNKSFTSFQALGGHRSKHNRAKNIIISSKGKEVLEPEEEEEERKVCINGTLPTNTCAAAAIGDDGYMTMMRCNSAGLSTEEEEEEEEEEASAILSEERLVVCSNINQENNSNNQEESGEASQSAGGLKMLDFDLNEPYVMDEGATEKSAICECPNFNP